MKKYFHLLSILILCGCSNNELPSSSYPEHQYSEIADLMITYDRGFDIDENDHFLYFYSETCYYCKQIKDEVIDFAINKHFPIYFIQANDSIPSNHNAEEINQTIKSNDVNDLFVGATPQLVLIEQGRIAKSILDTIYIELELSYYR